jgi:hypothetical protein
MSFRCFLPAWITAWATAVFLPSAIIAYLGLSASAAAIGTGLHRLPASTWRVADDVGPAVKLMVGGILLLGFLSLGQMRRVGRGAAILVGLVAVAATLALIPTSLSRGFAHALTGTRFDWTTTPLYLLGGIGAGLVFAIGVTRCQRAAAR